MPTDDERREVARRLRELAKDADEVSYFNLARTLGLGAVSRYGYDPDDVERLVDLIEPSEPKVKCVAEVKVDGKQLEKLAHDAVVELTGIDRDALLALADELEATAKKFIEIGTSDAEDEEAKMFVLHAAEYPAEIARRIREACGEAGA